MNFFKKLFGKKSEAQIQKNDSNSKKISIEEEFTNTMNILSKFKRTAYLPVIQKTSHSHSSKSKIGGLPYLRSNEDWPTCPNCKKNMQLFLQLNLEEIPIEKENGLIQLFYCTSSEPMCEFDLEAYIPFSKAVSCRRINAQENTKQIKSNIEDQFEEKTIVNWTSIDDYPHYEEYYYLGIELDISEDVYELMEQRQIGLPIEKDKLFGWPHWVQSVEYPHDRKTGNQMKLLFQLDSEDNLPYMFGDSGIGHLMQSPDHQDELSFGWACY